MGRVVAHCEEAAADNCRGALPSKRVEEGEERESGVEEVDVMALTTPHPLHARERSVAKKDENMQHTGFDFFLFSSLNVSFSSVCFLKKNKYIGYFS